MRFGALESRRVACRKVRDSESEIRGVMTLHPVGTRSFRPRKILGIHQESKHKADDI